MCKYERLSYKQYIGRYIHIGNLIHNSLNASSRLTEMEEKQEDQNEEDEDEDKDDDHKI